MRVLSFPQDHPQLGPVKVEIGGREVVQMRPFDKERIFPYAYRHTYAQRHLTQVLPSMCCGT